MGSPDSQIDSIRFGVYQIDQVKRELRKNGSLVKLQPQPFAVLLMLAQKPGQIVSRESIRGRIWASHTFVDFERSINFAINQIRSALHDDAAKPRYIETLPRQGYRFIASIESNHESEAIDAAGILFIDRKSVASPHQTNGVIAGDPKVVDEALPIAVTKILPALEAVAATTHQEQPSRSKKRRTFLPYTVVGGVLLLAAALAAGWLLHLRSNAGEIKEQQLTKNSNDNPILGVAISGDGKYLAFSDISGLHLELTRTGEVHDIPIPLELRGDNVSWSVLWLSDSTRFLAVASSDDQRPSTWQASVLGGPLRLLRKDAFAWSISPDDSSVAFTAANESEVWRMGIEGENPQKLFETKGHDWFVYIQWSPDSSRLLYIRRLPSPGTLDQSIEIRDIKADTSTVLLSNNQLQSVLWLHDGRILSVIRDSSGDHQSCNYWETTLNRSGTGFSAAPKQITHVKGFCPESTSATADGRQLFFLKAASEYSVYTAELASGGLKISPPKHLTLVEGREFPAAWTADSGEIIFVSDRSGQWGFYRQPLGSEAATPILLGIKSGGLGAIFPRLSPDGRWVVYSPYPVDYNLGDSVDLLRVPLAGGTPQLILKAPMYDTPRCAQAPAKLCAVAILDKGELIFTSFDPVMGRRHELTRFRIGDTSDRSSFGWALSPDGTRIAILKRSTSEIHLLSLVSMTTAYSRFTVGHTSCHSIGRLTERDSLLQA